MVGERQFDLESLWMFGVYYGCCTHEVPRKKNPQNPFNRTLTSKAGAEGSCREGEMERWRWCGKRKGGAEGLPKWCWRCNLSEARLRGAVVRNTRGCIPGGRTTFGGRWERMRPTECGSCSDWWVAMGCCCWREGVHKITASLKLFHCIWIPENVSYSKNAFRSSGLDLKVHNQPLAVEFLRY